MQINEDVLKSLSKEYNLPIAKETYQDLGKSAFKGEHLKNELGVFLEAVKNGTVATDSILVVYSLDRLSRLEIGYAKQTYYDLTNNGVSVYAVVDKHLYRAHNAADDIIATITFERAHNESKNKSSRVRDAAKEGLKKWKATGEPQSSLGRVPFWIDQSTNKLNKNAQGVLKAVELYLQGVGCLKIKQHLDAHYPYEAVRKTGRRTSRLDQWDFTAINQVFTKPSLIGEKHITIDGVKHKLENYYPPLIDSSTFQKLKQVKALKSGRVAKNGVNHLLKGLVKCGVCGGSMVFIDKGRGNAAINYVCTNAAKGNHKRENYSAQMLELVTLYLCQDHYLRQATTPREREEAKARLVLQRETLEEEVKGLKNRYRKNKSENILDLIDEADYQLRHVNEKLDSIEAFDPEEAFQKLSEDIYIDEVMNNFSHDRRKEIRNHLISVIDTVTVKREQKKSDYTKKGVVNCVNIIIYFRNKQIRSLTSHPYEYIAEGDVFCPISIASDNKDTDLVSRQGFHEGLIKKLFGCNLLNKLYPSKGSFKWEGKRIVLGKVESNTVDELRSILKAINNDNDILTNNIFIDFTRSEYFDKKNGLEKFCFNELGKYNLHDKKLFFKILKNSKKSRKVKRDVVSKIRIWINKL